LFSKLLPRFWAGELIAILFRVSAQSVDGPLFI